MVDKNLLNTLLRSDFPAFVQKVFCTLNPGAEFIPSWHIEAICEQLMRTQRGECRRLIVNLPPRALKSTIIAVAFPAFLMALNPTVRIIVASYSDDLARKLGRDFRAIVKSVWYREAFPAMAAAPRKDSEGEYVTAAHGFRLAASIGGTLTGLGADVLIVDDPIKAIDASSEAERNKVNDWVHGTLLNRLDKPEGVLIVTMQRLHQNDLSGFLLEKGGYDHLKIPAIALDNELAFALGNGRTYRRRKDEPLEQNRFGFEDLEKRRHEIGSILFSTQYQQEPLPEGGNIFKTEYLSRRYKQSECPSGYVVISWDTAGGKTGANNSYSAATVWNVVGNEYYLMDVVRGRWEFPDLLRQIDDLARRYKAGHVLVEDTMLGMGLIQDLKRNAVYDIIPIKPDQNKIMRAQICTGTFEAGRVWLPEDAPWLADFLLELSGFPNAKFDDQVDSVTQFINWVKERNTMELPCVDSFVVGPYDIYEEAGDDEFSFLA